MSRRFLERLDRGEIAESANDADANALFESVREHIEQLLRVRHGGHGTCPEYGLPDLTDVFTLHPRPFDELARWIRDTVSTYEPRLKLYRVEKPRATPSQKPSGSGGNSSQSDAYVTPVFHLKGRLTGTSRRVRYDIELGFDRVISVVGSELASR